MSAKKAKAPAASQKKPGAKPALKSASKAPAKTAALAQRPQGKPAKEGPIGSLKKMLGIGGGKGEAKAQPVAKGKAAPAEALAQRPQGKQALAPKGKGQVAPAQKAQGGKGAAAPAPTGKRGKAAVDSGLPKTALATSLRPPKAATEVVPGAPVCREVACELMATTGGYCRMHYIKNWKKIKRKEMILREKKLNSYIEELVSKYPDKYIEAIRQDLASEKDFAKVIADLEIDESLDDFETVETEGAEGIIDNLKRDFDDEGDVF